MAQRVLGTMDAFDIGMVGCQNDSYGRRLSQRRAVWTTQINGLMRKTLSPDG